ncbi:hypothetical protein [Zooshikella sp. RANM57]|uniref:hypothetical protein n=1 Tax=Zooshikella sp. RANM57 TaxID=3425863 RepID=UPI003D6F187B
MNDMGCIRCAVLLSEAASFGDLLDEWFESCGVIRTSERIVSIAKEVSHKSSAYDAHKHITENKRCLLEFESALYNERF